MPVQSARVHLLIHKKTFGNLQIIFKSSVQPTDNQQKHGLHTLRPLDGPRQRAPAPRAQ